jgi:phosphatidylglycerol lysyltransferase
MILAVAAGVIAQDLRSVSWQQVQGAVRSTPSMALFLAVLALAASLIAASTFDGLGFATLGKPAKWSETRLPSVLAFALANGGAPGLAIASGLRYRAYHTAELGGAQVALLSGVVAAIGLAGGLALVGLGAAGELAAAATAVHLPKGFGIVLALLGLKALAVYFLAPGVGVLKSILPARKVRFGIIAASTAEWTAAACILYLVLPADQRGTLLHFLPVFGLAGLLGAVSGLPGGVGAFDAVILAILGPRVGVAQVAGGLLLYRLIYVLGPLLAAAVIGVALSLSGRVRTAAHEAWDAAAPRVFGGLTFLSGIVMLVSTATPDAAPRLRLLAALAPRGLVEASHFIASLAGVVLLFLAFGLGGRVRRAFFITLGALLLAVVATLAKGLNYEEALFLGVLAALLASSHRAFDRRGAGLLAETLTPGGLTAIMAALAAAAWLGFFAFRHVNYSSDLWWTFITDRSAPRFLRALAGAAILTVLVMAWRFSRPSRRPEHLPSAADLEAVAVALSGAEQATVDANLAFLGDKFLLFSESRRSFVQYGVRGTSWISMGDPVGPAAERKEMIWAFRSLCDREGAHPAFYAVTRESVADYVDCGLVASKIGETAIVDLADFNLEGGRRATLRQAFNRGQREGVVFEVVPPEAFDALAPDLRVISDDWLAIHSGEEKGFSLGRFDPAYLRRFPTGLLRREGRIVAFANLWRTPEGKTLSIDLMRYGREAPKNAMDILFVNLMLWGKTQGYAQFDLGMAPLSGLDARPLASSLTRLGAMVYAEGGSLYGFEGLRAFKEKFGPRWEPVYIAAPGGWILGRTLADAALLSSGGIVGLLH